MTHVIEECFIFNNHLGHQEQHAVTQLVEALRYKPRSIPDCVIGIFYWHNPSGCTMTLGSTQPLTEMSSRNVSWG